MATVISRPDESAVEAQALIEEARRRQRRRRWVLSGVAAAVLAVVLFLVVGGGTRRSATPPAGTLDRAPSRLATARCAGPLRIATYVSPGPPGISFEYPACWRAVQYSEVSSFSSAMVFLSNQATHPPCVTTTYPAAAGSGGAPRPVMSMTCGWPVTRLAPGGVLVKWSNFGFPDWSLSEVSGSSLTVGGLAAREQTSLPGDCRMLGADETITVDVAGGVASNDYEMTACLRGPDLQHEVAEVQRMLSTTSLPNS
jgi:hypothetical protein